jgi:hypothetical protein
LAGKQRAGKQDEVTCGERHELSPLFHCRERDQPLLILGDEKTLALGDDAMAFGFQAAAQGSDAAGVFGI